MKKETYPSSDPESVPEKDRIDITALLSALDLIHGYCCVFDIQGKLIFMNLGMKSWLGYAQYFPVEENAVELLVDTGQGKIRADLKDFLSKSPSKRELSIRLRDKSEILVMAEISPLKQGEQVIGGILFLEDISEKRKIEYELRNSQRELVDIIESLPDATLVIDKNGRILHWNRAMVELTGYAAENMVGKDNYEHGWALYNGVRRPMLVDMIVNPGLDISHLYTDFRQEGDILVTDNNLAFLKGQQKITWGRAAPIYDNTGKVVGAIETIRDITERRQQEEALKKSRDQLQFLLNSTVHALAITAEKRDHYTAEHQERVAKLACAIGRQMKLPEETIKNIEIAGTLHDIGKLFIPMDILSNSGKLRDIEKLFLMTHSVAGFDIIKDIPFSGPIAQIIAQHHERIDGSGYPQGLKGNEILIEAKIVAVADTIEAMASHRPYRAALGLAKALEEIQKNAGVRYDKEVVNACVELIKEHKYDMESIWGLENSGRQMDI